MIREARLGDPDLGLYVADAPLAVAQQPHDRPADRISERLHALDHRPGRNRRFERGPHDGSIVGRGISTSSARCVPDGRTASYAKAPSAAPTKGAVQ